LQVPAPLQVPTGVAVEPTHAAVPHEVVVGAFLQAPAPSHVPMNPHGGLAAQRPCGSAPSAGTSLQEPSCPMMLQASQVPQLEVEQQTPSTQALPVRQSSSAVHGWPRRFLSPQVFSCRSQIAGGAQSPSARQVAPQVVPLQA
jgi:hypothetical protein